MTNWNPERYLRFKAERAQPFHDLFALVERRPQMRVVDLGCGTGEWTRIVADELHATEAIGIDNSPEMLSKCSAFVGNGVHFVDGNIEDFSQDRHVDLLFSNAALHWVPDHLSLFRRLRASLRDGGQIAVQMPANESHSSHVIAGWVGQRFGVEPRVSPILSPEQYASLLHSLGFARQNVKMQIYGHLLESSRAVVEWVRGTLLTDYQRRIPAAQWDRYLEEYTSELLREIGDVAPYFYTYKRVLIWAAL